VKLLGNIIDLLGEIMSEDAAVQAVVTDENTQIQNLTTAVTSLQSLIQALQTEVSAGTALQPSTLASLQAAQSALDSLAAAAEADVTADSPPAATPPAS
jgi:capsule polysaccharide export protein KpsE/RkpR